MCQRQKHTKAAIVLNIEVESINGNIPEGTRATNSRPLLGGRAKGKPQEVCKGFGRVFVLDLLVIRYGSSKGQEDLLPKSLADGDILPQLMAVGQQIGVIAVDGKGLAAALIAKVAFRPSVQALVREHIDEAKVDDIQRGLLTEMSQPVLVGSLALSDSQ